MGSAISARCAHARDLFAKILEADDPGLKERLKAMITDEDAIGYWQGPLINRRADGI